MEIVDAATVNEVLNLIIELTSGRIRLQIIHVEGGALERFLDFFPDYFPNFFYFVFLRLKRKVENSQKIS